MYFKRKDFFCNLQIKTIFKVGDILALLLEVSAEC